MNINLGDLYNRPQEFLQPTPQIPGAIDQAMINYPDWGYVPGIAQNAQNTPPTNFVTGKSYFDTVQLAVAQWFTTRVHITPLGKV